MSQHRESRGELLEYLRPSRPPPSSPHAAHHSDSEQPRLTVQRPAAGDLAASFRVNTFQFRCQCTDSNFYIGSTRTGG